MLLISAMSRAACIAVTNIPGITIQSLILPARDSPLITPLSPWYSQYTRGYSCSTNIMTYFFAAGSSANFSIPGYYRDPSDGINYPIIATNPFYLTSGVGYIMGMGPDSSHITPFTPNQSTLYQAIAPTSSNVYVFYKVRLIRYSQLSSNTITVNGGFAWAYTVSSPYPDGTITNNNATSAVVAGSSTLTLPAGTGTTCSVNTPNLQVNLPSIQSSQLGSIGATTGNTPFSLAVNCPTAVSVYMTMTDNSNPNQTSNIITAASGSTAQGVGVQVSRNGLPVYMGPASSVAGNTSQFLIGNNLTGTISIPFTARYIRTGRISPGSLKAVATFTMSYQ